MLRLKHAPPAFKEVLSSLEEGIDERVELMLVKAQLKKLILDDKGILLVIVPDRRHRAVLGRFLGKRLDRHESLLCACSVNHSLMDVECQRYRPRNSPIITVRTAI